MIAFPSERAAAAEAEAGISLGAASIAFGSCPGYLAAARQGAVPEQDRGPVLPGPSASDYERYLHTGELLALQKAVELRAHRDELLFQVTHQTAELWLKLADDELREATACLRRDAVMAGTRLLGRASLCLRLVIDGMAMLERGGNAFDAGVAAAFTLQMVEPHLNGPGGDVPVILWDARAGKPLVICGQGTAPSAATIASRSRTAPSTSCARSRRQNGPSTGS